MKREQPGAPRLHRPIEVAQKLGCSEWWIKEQARRRRIPYAWIGGSYRFTDEHVAEIVRLFEVRPGIDEASSPCPRRVPRPRSVGAATSASPLKARSPRRRRNTDAA